MAEKPSISHRDRGEILKDIYRKTRDFFDNELTFYAASLSFYTIFAVIPLLLIVMSVAANLPSFDGYVESIKSFILENMMPTYTETITQYLDAFMANSFRLGAVGLIYVLFTSVMFFKNYEFIIAKIFATKTRGFWSALTTYWTLITLMPIGLILSIFLSSKIQGFLDASTITSSINFISLLPYLLIWLIFFALFKISSSAFVTSKAALIASFLSSLVWSISKEAFIYYVLYNKAYMSIYGSFSIVLFFFLWIYFSWIIILYGMSLCALLNKRYTN